MKALHLTACEFLRPMAIGRTKPLLLGAETDGGDYYEVVVKLRNRELSRKAQLVELVSALLADALGLAVPQPSVVTIPDGFHVVTTGEPADMLRESTGPNFGSVHLGSSFTAWTPERGLSGDRKVQAASIFAFDLLAQNSDRLVRNPNLWVRSDVIGVYDHEVAFTFLYLPILGEPTTPWSPVPELGSTFDFMRNHALRHDLQKGRTDFGQFECKLKDLSDSTIESLFSAVPHTWTDGHDLTERLAAYLCDARENRTELINLANYLLTR